MLIRDAQADDMTSSLGSSDTVYYVGALMILAGIFKSSWSCEYYL